MKYFNPTDASTLIQGNKQGTEIKNELAVATATEQAHVDAIKCGLTILLIAILSRGSRYPL